MVLTLDPSLPLLWRSPHSLQFGLDRPRVVLEQVSRADELLIAALTAGVSRSGAEMIGRAAGLSSEAIRRLLDTLEPVFTTQPTPAQRRITVSGSGETAARLRLLVSASGAELAEPDSNADLAVVVAQFVIEPERHQYWLRRDIPHLPVVFGDELVRIGPLVRPGVDPCLYCLELHRTDADPAWPAIASQLWNRSGVLETPRLAAEVAALVARLAIDARPIAGGTLHRVAPESTLIELDAASGDRTLRSFGFHPDCGCVAVSA
jgi:bacteriocin biosynthesis cyclodehydratase domain-containing protein